MNKSLKYLLSLLFFIQISCQEKKEHQKTKTMTKYEWLDATSAPLGYPVDVYRGGLESGNGEFTSLYSGTTGGSWGEANRGMSNGEKSVPNHLHVIWVSYAEKIFYEIDTNLDDGKMIDLFRNGYYTPSNGDNPNPRKENYNQIIVGFAPGGVVVIWIAGAGRQVEIGRYQGKKITIPQSEIDALSPGPQKNMFDPEYQRKIIHEFGIVPPEVVKANEGKPIPYGLWDSYRKEYNWNVQVELPDNGKTKEVTYFHYNGEMEITFGEILAEKYNRTIPNELKWDTLKKRAAANDIKILWIDGADGYRYVSNVEFDEKEIFPAFKEISSDDPNAKIELKITVNIPKTTASVKLVSGDKQVWLKNSKIMVRKTKYKD
ncbi:DUF2931 family protein [Chryseobacterium sp. RP-3-3]|uniref:DUF2931 family protein n=1 Tax=Chryseobacterium antibioticum TaxID=2728847 RepID=A0A7Y0AL04_9FLAO|nr:DUF2931 family protein [Chryseobacterium antibioticum]NML69288.1 DUF2931 family protein [Chryseobacterium antibioticum]